MRKRPLTEHELIEARNTVRQIAHRPLPAIAQIVSERMKLKEPLTVDEVKALLNPSKE